MTSPLFCRTYSEARGRFMSAAAAHGFALESHVIPAVEGREGEALATDVVRLGPADAKRLLVLTSGTHGVEGFCGSAAQTALLGDTPLQARLATLGVAVLVVHAINPYGFSWLSRTNEDNVDLNRNSIDFAQPLPFNEGYEALHTLLVPPQWPPSDANSEALASWISRHGEAAYQHALTTGQFHQPDGLFYGGARPVWSTRLIRTLLDGHAGLCKQIGWIDFHTGLGPAGHGEKICVGRIDAAELARARAWWGADVASPLDGSTIASNVGGPILDTLRSSCPHAQTTAIAIEFGTVPLVPMLHMLRADVWVRRHPDTPQAPGIREQIRAAFCFDDPVWQGQILGQSRAAILQGVLGLSRS